MPKWQAGQYMHDLFSGQVKLEPTNNDLYPDLRWITVRALLGD